MKKILAGVALIGMMGNVFASCDYNFDATASDYAQISYATHFPNSNAQSSSVQVQLASPTKMYVDLNHKLAQTQQFNQINSNSGLIVPNDGIFIVEGKIDSFPSTTPTGTLVLGGTVYGYGASSSFSLSYSIQNSVGDVPRLIIASTPSALGGTQSIHLNVPISLPLAPNYKIGFYFNKNSGQVGVIANGVNYGYISNFSFQTLASVNFSFFGMMYIPQSNDSTIGATLKETLITDASKITQSYPTGAKDICGNII